MARNIKHILKRVYIYMLLCKRTACTPRFRWEYTKYILEWYGCKNLRRIVTEDLQIANTSWRKVHGT